MVNFDTPAYKEKMIPFLPKKWLSLYGVSFMLLMYFVALPLGGILLCAFFLSLTMVPALQSVGFFGALILFLIGTATGINAVANVYLFSGYTAAATLLTQANVPRELATMTCDGYEIQANAGSEFRVERTYLGGSPLGYALHKVPVGFVTFSSPNASQKIILAEGNLGYLTETPLLTTSNSYVLNGAELPSSDEHVLDENDALMLSTTTFTVEDFKHMRSCLQTYESTHGPLRSVSSVFAPVFAILYDSNPVVPEWSSSANQFSCIEGLMVHVSEPGFINSTFHRENEIYDTRIGLVEADKSARPFTAEEIQHYSPFLAIELKSFEKAKACVSTGTCSSEGEYASYIEYFGPGFKNGFPKAFDSCKNEGGESIQEFLNS